MNAVTLEQNLRLFLAILLIRMQYKTSFTLALVAASCIDTNLLATAIIHHAFIAILDWDFSVCHKRFKAKKQGRE